MFGTLKLFTFNIYLEDHLFGTALKCLQEFMIETYGEAKWRSLLAKAGLPPEKVYHTVRFYPDSEFQSLLDISSEEFRIDKNLLLRDFGKLFGEHLISVYGCMFLKQWKSLDVIEKVAPKVFVTIQFVDPYTPRSSVKCERVSPEEVVIHYHSPRKMCVYILGIIDAVGDHFREKLVIKETQCMHNNDRECVMHVRRLYSY